MLTEEVRAAVQAARHTDPDVYVALAALAHEHGHAALALGLRLWISED